MRTSQDDRVIAIASLVDLNSNQAMPLGDIYAGIARPLEVPRITYAAADGMQIPA